MLTGLLWVLFFCGGVSQPELQFLSVSKELGLMGASHPRKWAESEWPEISLSHADVLSHTLGLFLIQNWVFLPLAFVRGQSIQINIYEDK